MHCLTGEAISNYTYDDLKANKDNKNTDQYLKRQLAKKVNFGTIYCMSGQKLQQQLWSELRINESVEQCEAYLSGFFTTYPGVKQYIEDTNAFVAKYNFTYTYLGRRRRFAMPTTNSKMFRQAVNARIQSTSADLVCLNLVDVGKYVKSVGGRLLLTVHDSIVFQLPKGLSGVKSVLDDLVITKTAERAPWLPVVWKYDVGRGPNYGDTHDEVL